MSEENAAVEESTITDVSTNESVESVSESVQQNSTTETQQESTQETTQKEYAAKFMKDGELDADLLHDSYVKLEKKLRDKMPLAPDTIDAYDYAPEWWDAEDDYGVTWKNNAKELGLTAEQYEGVMKQYEDAVEQFGMTPEKAQAQLEAEWGKDAFGENLGYAKRAFDEYAPSDLSSEDPALNHPSVLKLLARIGADLGEDANLPKGSSSSPGLTLDEIADIRSKDPDKYWSHDFQKQIDEAYKRYA